MDFLNTPSSRASSTTSSAVSWESRTTLFDQEDSRSRMSSTSGNSPSSRASSSSLNSCYETPPTEFRSVLINSRNPLADLQAHEILPELLKAYILQRCSMNPYCNQQDFDDTALEALLGMPLLQSLQTVEHFAASVSPRIIKSAAYLMGILRGQEAHWDKPLTSGTQMPLNGKQLLQIPPQILVFIGRLCLQGNCMPSDFTPEVVMSLHGLTVELAVSAVSAFNSNKRIVAGAKGGVVNRSRFLLRLIQNVAEQNSFVTQQQQQPPLRRALSENHENVRQQSLHSVKSAVALTTQNSFRKVQSFLETTATTPEEKESNLTLEQLAELDFGEDKVKTLEKEVQASRLRERQLMSELRQAQCMIADLQAERQNLRMRLISQLQ